MVIGKAMYDINLSQDELDILNRYSSYQTISREGRYVELIKSGTRCDSKGRNYHFENRKYIMCAGSFGCLSKFKKYDIKELLKEEGK